MSEIGMLLKNTAPRYIFGLLSDTFCGFQIPKQSRRSHEFHSNTPERFMKAEEDYQNVGICSGSPLW